MIRIPRRSVPMISLIVLLAGFPAPARGPSTDIAPFDTAGLVDSWQFPWPREELGRSAALSVSRALADTGRFEMLDAERPCASGAGLGVTGTVMEYGLVARNGGDQKIGKWEWGRGAGGVSVRVGLSAALIDCASGRTTGRFNAENTMTLDDADAERARAKELDRAFLVRILAAPAADLSRQIAAASPGTAESVAVAAAPEAGQDERRGKIVNIDGERIYVNLGSLHGVTERTILQVSRPGPAIIDPDTGEVLGADEVLVGKLEVEQVLGEKLSRTRAAGGSGFQIRDRVRPNE